MAFLNSIISPKTLSQDMWKEINFLTQENIKNGMLPYLSKNPMPQDLNLVNGCHLGDINKICLELECGRKKMGSLEWIFEGDAEILNLHLKSKNEQGFIFEEKIERNGEKSQDIQVAFFVEQFSPESIKRLFDNEYLEQVNNDEQSAKRIKQIAHLFIKNLDEYNRGERENKFTKQKQQNLKENISNQLIFEKIKTETNVITKNFSNAEKTIFSHLQDYYLQQITGLSVYTMSKEKEEKVLQAFKELSLVDTPRLTNLLTNSFVLADRKTHYEFEKQRIYSEQDKQKNLTVIVPELSKSDKMNQSQKKEKLRDRDRTLRPQHRRGI